MTTSTLPDIDLEQWLEGEIEKTCEVAFLPDGRPNLGKQNPEYRPCERPAAWALSVRLICPDKDALRTFYICDTCQAQMIHQGIMCGTCGTSATITWTERIR